MLTKTIPLVLVALASVALSSDNLDLNFDYYCDEKLSCVNVYPGGPNTMCNATLKFASNCVDAKYVPITDELKQLFLDGHNKFRNELALGKTGHIFDKKTAADMATVSWDDELELMSLRNALDCEIQHDQCHKTEKYKKPGQNLGAFCSNSRNGPSIEKSIREVVQDWYDEYKHVPNLDEVESLGSSRARKPIGHWSQFVQSKSQRIGCSVVKFTNDDKNNCIVIGCNYSAGNLAGYPIFSFGTPASLCKTGANQQYPGLCSPNEDFSQHKNGDVYFENNAPDSPVVKQWLENGKKLDH